MKLCEKCKEYMYAPFRDGDEYICQCKKFTILSEDGDCEVWANDDELAALKYAETSNEDGDYYLMNESSDILVNGKSFRISAEPDIHYSAKPL